MMGATVTDDSERYGLYLQQPEPKHRTAHIIERPAKVLIPLAGRASTLCRS